MKRLYLILCLFSMAAFSNAQLPTIQVSQKIDSFFRALGRNGQFSGAAIVGDERGMVYSGAVGIADRKTGESFTTRTACYIGSLSKQFTAVGIVQLKEKGLLAYSDPIRKHFPSLPVTYDPVTILDLLHHTSGLPVFNDYPDMTEQDVFEIIQKQTALRFVPGSRFEYCNANYTLLGMLIAKLSGKSLDAYLTEHVFVPAGMQHSYVDRKDNRDRKRATGYYLFGEENNYSTYLGGAASVVSTAEDLYNWSLALRRPTFISNESYKEIFTPGENQWQSADYGTLSYGFGWFLHIQQGDTIMQHDGGFAGFRAYIERDQPSNRTILFVSNVRHELIGNIRSVLVHILNGEPYLFPRISAANSVLAAAPGMGMGNAIAAFGKIKLGPDSSSYDFSEREFNSLGYYLINQKKLPDAIALFKFNTELFPNSGNAFDSLGEAYLATGDRSHALQSYQRAAALDPSNKNAKNIIKKLQEN
jgi:CubicO group peptidase (beta-lactamase class C family)